MHTHIYLVLSNICIHAYTPIYIHAYIPIYRSWFCKKKNPRCSLSLKIQMRLVANFSRFTHLYIGHGSASPNHDRPKLPACSTLVDREAGGKKNTLWRTQRTHSI